MVGTMCQVRTVQQESVMPLSSNSSVHCIAPTAQLSTLSVGRSVLTTVPRVQRPPASAQVSVMSAVSVPSRLTYVGNASPAQSAQIMMISGCKDEQTSMDARGQGACTVAFKSAHDEALQARTTWKGFLAHMHMQLKQRRFKQLPELSTNFPLDLNDQFSLGRQVGGRKMALMIGINYPNSAVELNGCHKDVDCVQTVLKQNGVPPQNMRILRDNGRDHRPTKANILQGLKWLVTNARDGDWCFLHYSGHGSQVPDAGGSEVDGLDEVLVPSDYRSKGFILDDELHRLLVDGLATKKVHVFCLFDCCHSGTMLDLPYKTR